MSWWFVLSMGTALGLLASFYTPRDWLIVRYWWLALIPFLGCLGCLVCLLRKGEGSGKSAHGPDDAPAVEEPSKKTRGVHTTTNKSMDGSSGKTRYAKPSVTRYQRVGNGREHSVDRLLGDQAVEQGNMPQARRNRRRVRLVKVWSKMPGGSGGMISGLEESPPEVGKCYRVYTEQGTLYVTTAVAETGPEYIRTKNSFYELRVLDP